MGLYTSSIKWLILMKKTYGISFDKTLTLGRQYCSVAELKKCITQLKKIERKGDGRISEKDASIIYSQDGYADNALRYIGARVLDFMDYSNYESANIIHDMNRPISQEIMNSYDVVIDGGTMEHVFNYPQAISNAMNLVKPGGFLFIIVPTNGWCGHGFYQCSPCVFLDILTKENGFELKSIYLHEVETLGRDRVLKLVNHHGNIFTRGRGLLYVTAQKIGRCPDHIVVQQGDYVAKWESNHNKFENRLIGVREYLKSFPFITMAFSRLRYFLQKMSTISIDDELMRLL